MFCLCLQASRFHVCEPGVLCLLLRLLHMCEPGFSLPPLPPSTRGNCCWKYRYFFLSSSSLQFNHITLLFICIYLKDENSNGLLCQPQRRQAKETDMNNPNQLIQNIPGQINVCGFTLRPQTVSQFWRQFPNFGSI